MNATLVIERIEELHLAVEVEGETLWLSPSSAIPDDLVPSIREHKEDILRHYQLLTMPFPMGYKGLPEATVVAAEAYNDWAGVTNAIRRKLRVLSWVLDHLRNETPLGREMPAFYWEVKSEKHKLIHADYEQSGLPLECGYCNIPEFVDPTEDG
jgi:hypothetical protein